jgi:hypothetical protein
MVIDIRKYLLFQEVDKSCNILLNRLKLCCLSKVVISNLVTVSSENWSTIGLTKKKKKKKKSMGNAICRTSSYNMICINICLLHTIV